VPCQASRTDEISAESLAETWLDTYEDFLLQGQPGTTWDLNPMSYTLIPLLAALQIILAKHQASEGHQQREAYIGLPINNRKLCLLGRTVSSEVADDRTTLYPISNRTTGELEASTDSYELPPFSSFRQLR
jgi:hypothetical protein